MEIDDEEMLSVWGKANWWLRSEQDALSNEEKQEVRGICKDLLFLTQSMKVSKSVQDRLLPA